MFLKPKALATNGVIGGPYCAIYGPEVTEKMPAVIWAKCNEVLALSIRPDPLKVEAVSKHTRTTENTDDSRRRITSESRRPVKVDWRTICPQRPLSHLKNVWRKSLVALPSHSKTTYLRGDSHFFRGQECAAHLQRFPDPRVPQGWLIDNTASISRRFIRTNIRKLGAISRRNMRPTIPSWRTCCVPTRDPRSARWIA